MSIKAFIALLVLVSMAIWANFNRWCYYLYLSGTAQGDSILNFLPTHLGLRVSVMVLLLLFYLL